LVTDDNNSEIFGCTDNTPYEGSDENYPSEILQCGDDGQQQCLSSNYNPDATYNQGCEYPIQGCTNVFASNYNPQAVSDNESCQYLNDTWEGVNEYGNPYYYPVIPKFNGKGSFKPEVFGLQTNFDGTERIPFGGIFYDGENWTPNDLIAEVTTENSTNQDLLINVNSNIVTSNVLSDNSGNKNLGFLISDKKVTFDENTTSVKKTKRFDIVKRNKSNGAF